MPDSVPSNDRATAYSQARLIDELRDYDRSLPAKLWEQICRQAADEIERLQEKVRQLEMPWAQLMKQANADEGVDTQVFMTRLWKKVEDQQRELARLQKQSTGNEPRTNLDGTTHAVGCHTWGHKHYECALSEIERLSRPPHEREPPHCSTCECGMEKPAQPPGEAYRVFCPQHDTHKARYHDGRPELDDQCPTCAIESLEDRVHGAEVGAAILRERLAAQPPSAGVFRQLLKEYVANMNSCDPYQLGTLRHFMEFCEATALTKSAQPPFPSEVPAAHREGTEPMSRIVADIESSVACINPEHPIHATLTRVAGQLRAALTKSVSMEGVPFGDPHPCDMSEDELRRALRPSQGE